ncbi:MAG: ATP-dependent DNA helicase RecG [Acidimicrobiales bacterium]
MSRATPDRAPAGNAGTQDAPAGTPDPAPARRGTLRYLDGLTVDRVSKVGPKSVDALAQLGIYTVLDLLTHYPRRYLDRTAQAAISDMAVGEEATVLATVRRVAGRRTRQGRALVEADVFDGRAYMRVVFFNQGWRAKQLKAGRQALFFGKLDSYKGRRQMTNPVVDLVGEEADTGEANTGEADTGEGNTGAGGRTNRIVPVYPQSEKANLTTWELGGWIAEAVRRATPLLDPVPGRFLEALGLIDRDAAMRAVHAPETMEEAESGRRRLAFDELLRLQLGLVSRKRATERAARGIRHRVQVGTEAGELLAQFRQRLPFSLTKAQDGAIDEILADLAGPLPMHRLLQGDVGSGKTVVALAALLVAVQGGHQGALMAPTEVLAEQHLIGLRRLVSGLSVPDAGTLTGDRPVEVAGLTHRTTPTERTRLHAALRSGAVDILVGTHALLTEEVGFASLGVVVIDEQHRFGVDQRAVLKEKGGAADPDVLVMTATPIPRTAAMTVFGDLDVTTMAERPAGRVPVTTVWARTPVEVAAAWAKVREEVGAGRRAYVVCPLVEGSERVEAASAVEEAGRLAGSELAGLSVGLLHGQLPARAKEAAMEAFRSGAVDVLVATTVVEVGVDVADATVMVVEDAGRFGMAQLHQLRGRVGRGADRSWCYLLGEGGSPEAEARLAALERSDDGFELAEVDLDLRGEGTILGTRQKGRSDLRLASLRRDRELVERAREVAFAVVDAEGGLPGQPDLLDEVALMVGEEGEYLFRG